MSVLAAAIGALFDDPNLARDALYRAGGADPAVPVRVILRQPDRIGDFGERCLAAETMTIDVRVSEASAPAEGDTVEAGSKTFVVQGEPIRDAERLVWTTEARAKADLG